ncbi:zinc ribbon domain-containing protein [Mediterraneibacter sp.]|jgi:hypothetical protein|uniref:zinc ribbon domain-containing protein n=1 Tax=Mediterraneibacter sp. TaxID=2316022 RepID=UPI0027B88628|nr:zinc ribbon domain-containing protein [Mediterraneibacter sp.]
MFCEKCGKEIKEVDKFCPYCGAENKTDKAESVQTAPSDFKDKGTGKKKKGAVIAIIALVIIVAIGIFKCSSKDEILRYNVHVINNTGFDIYALYASEPEVDDWEEDLLGNDILRNGERVDIEFVITEEDLDWDFAIENFEGNILEFYGLSFAECDVKGATLILEYDGYEGTASLY